ncbi:glucosamine-6-phosphate deaminase [Suicoccus acidiformans]|uniref:Glucosamine-6-phosphate deaminase n=1 Tax=Suicoccus acidiformans TaxID=2036206 RepID=A0A347WNG3_9LACT|nr:glucosamine-6-phosphate deaminase [Suicoccus acidiformans]AXY26620.1 glucosamine-6-phosphate deaminase [Suicoccus acidiformans]
MDIKIFQSAQEATEEAFRLLAAAKEDGATTFGLATGSSPEGLYELLRASDLDFTDAYALNLDEYRGLPADHEQSYAYFMQDKLFKAKPFKETFIPNGMAEDPEEEVARYDQVIKNHPIDFQILGIGPNGHIGFNEPGTSFEVTTHLTDLAPATIQANQRFFESEADVPKQAYTMGIASILNSKQIVLMAFGEAKAQAVKGMIEGSVTEALPASVLQTHENVTVLLDQDSASLLSH